MVHLTENDEMIFYDTSQVSLPHKIVVLVELTLRFLDLIRSIPLVDFFFRDGLRRIVEGDNQGGVCNIIRRPNGICSLLVVRDDDGFILRLDDVVKRVHEDVVVAHFRLFRGGKRPDSY